MFTLFIPGVLGKVSSFVKDETLAYRFHCDVRTAKQPAHIGVSFAEENVIPGEYGATVFFNSDSTATQGAILLGVLTAERVSDIFPLSWPKTSCDASNFRITIYVEPLRTIFQRQLNSVVEKEMLSLWELATPAEITGQQRSVLSQAIDGETSRLLRQLPNFETIASAKSYPPAASQVAPLSPVQRDDSAAVETTASADTAAQPSATPDATTAPVSDPVTPPKTSTSQLAEIKSDDPDYEQKLRDVAGKLSAETLRLIKMRKIRVLRHAEFDPTQRELPDSFYEPSVGDTKRIWAGLQKQMEDETDKMLMTRELREQKARKQEAAKKRYSQCLIQVRMPDRVILQMEFSPLETVGHLVIALRKCLRNPQAEFELSSPPHMLKDESATFQKCQLVPYGKIYVRDKAERNETSPPYLNDDLMSLLEEEDEIDDPLLHEGRAKSDAPAPEQKEDRKPRMRTFAEMEAQRRSEEEAKHRDLQEKMKGSQQTIDALQAILRATTEVEKLRGIGPQYGMPSPGLGATGLGPGVSPNRLYGVDPAPVPGVVSSGILQRPQARDITGTGVKASPSAPKRSGIHGMSDLSGSAAATAGMPRADQFTDALSKLAAMERSDPYDRFGTQYGGGLGLNRPMTGPTARFDQDRFGTALPRADLGLPRASSTGMTPSTATATTATSWAPPTASKRTWSTNPGDDVEDDLSM